MRANPQLDTWSRRLLMDKAASIKTWEEGTGRPDGGGNDGEKRGFCRGLTSLFSISTCVHSLYFPFRRLVNGQHGGHGSRKTEPLLFKKTPNHVEVVGLLRWRLKA